MNPASKFLPVLLALTLAACGGGSGSDTNSPGGTSPTTGTVGILLTDAPTDEFCQIRMTIEAIDLLGTNGPTNIFSGPETVNILDLRNYADMIAVDPEVPAILKPLVKTDNSASITDQDIIDRMMLPLLKETLGFGGAVRTHRLNGERLDGRERVLHAVVQLVYQQRALLFGALALGDIDGRAHCADWRSGRVRLHGAANLHPDGLAAPV